nr:MAG TPA: hypothetical protein [Caudoviricetes sp.]
MCDLYKRGPHCSCKRDSGGMYTERGVKCSILKFIL